MYSLVLMAAMTASTETSSFGSVWSKHCFWESCLPARYGWVPCGPGYSAFYPAAYTSCCGFGGHQHVHHHSCHGCYGACHGCWSSCYGCGGCWGGGYLHACGGGYYNCYGGGGMPNIYSGIGYAGFGAYGNFGNYGTVPVYAAPVYASPVFDPQNQRPLEVRPLEARPIEAKPIEIVPMKVMNVPAKASVVVRVPDGAKVYIDDHLMTSTATERTFTSPAIEPGESYFYTIRVVVRKDGNDVEDVQKVSVKAGEVSRLSFDNLFDRVRPEERTIVDSSRNRNK